MSEQDVRMLKWAPSKKGVTFTLHQEIGQTEKKLGLQKVDCLEPSLRKPGISPGQVEVECSVMGGQPVWVRGVGSDWTGKAVPSRPTVSPARDVPISDAPSTMAVLPVTKATPSGISNSKGAGSEAELSMPPPSPRKERTAAAPRPPGQFQNPYNFVPAPRRDSFVQGLEDEDPRVAGGHHRLHEQRWSGKIAVKLETETPLLIPDAVFDGPKDGHKSYRIRRDANGNPYLPPTSVKGMLRSAYEAVTASRMGELERHDAPLAYRQPTTMGVKVVPARIEAVSADSLGIVLLPGFEKTIGNNGFYAALLPAYRDNAPNPEAPSYAGKKHGDAVTVQLKKPDKKAYWLVTEIEKAGARKPDPTKRLMNGYLCWTEHNIEKKTYERVFFAAPGNEKQIEFRGNDLTRLSTQWTALIDDYCRQHEPEFRKGKTGPSEMDGCKWSRHITPTAAERDLKPGMLCYADVEVEGTDIQVKALYPVTISRALHDRAPMEMIHDSIRPADAYEKLSPADRVFGWVNQEGSGAWKGRLRIGPTHCQTRDAIESFEEKGGIPLSILGQPKPQQGGFYLAKDEHGCDPLPDGTPKKDSYADAGSIRGRKVYPHHAGLPTGHWDDPTKDRTQTVQAQHYQEYRRPPPRDRQNAASDRDDQNRTMLEWIKPKAQFTFDMYVENLSDVEIGALLWLLELKGDHFFRLGGGKPLGFGSVRLSVDWNETQLATGEGWKHIWLSLDEPTFQPENELAVTIRAFKDAVVSSWQSVGHHCEFEKVPWIQAFVAAARGSRLPTHYPRVTRNPNPDGKTYEWFVENEGQAKDGGGLKLSLLTVGDERGLPYHASNPKVSASKY